MAKAPSEVLKKTKLAAKKGSKKVPRRNGLMDFISKAKHAGMKEK